MQTNTLESIQRSTFAQEPIKGNLNKIISSKSLFLFGYNNVVRAVCRKIVNSKLFECGVMGMIIATCIGLALEDPMAGNDSSIHNDRLVRICFLTFLARTATVGHRFSSVDVGCDENWKTST